MSIQFTTSFRIVTFVPPDHVEAVINAVVAVDPLQYGDDYTQVSWQSTPGVERFKSELGANPTAGAIGEVSEEPSVRLEFSLPFIEDQMEAVVFALLLAHPWEEPVLYVHLVQEVQGLKKTLKKA
ncbi:MAG: hypothetical protein V1754_15495 [Pseudomonadota bacterium]